MTTDLDLPGIRRVITHKDCADGILSALIACDALGLDESAVVFVQYNTPEHVQLQPREGDCFIDMTPWCERGSDGEPSPRGWEQIDAWVSAGTRVLDHHAGAKEIVHRFCQRGVYADAKEEPGVSGAALAYRELMLPDSRSLSEVPFRTVARLAEYIGIRDTWQRLEPLWEHACAFAAATRFFGFEALLAENLVNGWEYVDNMLCLVGPPLLAEDHRRARACLATAHRLTVEGLRVVAFEGVGPTSDAKDIESWSETPADLVVGWHIFAEGEKTKMVLSLRGTVALALAQHHGGGGHKLAAGFTVDVDRNDGSPVDQIARLIRFWRWAQEGSK